MPKEYFHWWVAQEAAATSQGTLGRLLNRHQPLFLLGAVFPDSSFYGALSLEADRFVRAGYRLHGSAGEDTLRFLRDLAQLPDGLRPAPVWAFAAGIAAHLVTDAVVHPFVYFLTGHDNARGYARLGADARHAALETAMDRSYRASWGPRRPRHVADAVVQSDLDQTILRAARLVLFREGKVSNATVRRCIYRHGAIQQWFVGRREYWLGRCVTALIPFDLKSALALSYRHPGWPPLDPGEPVAYRHPVTGQRLRASLRELAAQAVEQTRRVMDRIGEALASGMPPPLAELSGASALTGLVADTRPMRYFSEVFPGQPGETTCR